MSGSLLTLAEDLGELAQRARLGAINLAVAAAKVKLADPAFRDANDRIVQLVTRATETAAAVERLTRQLSGDGRKDEDVQIGAASLERLEELVVEVESVSNAIVEEVQRLSLRHQPLRGQST
jgi:uncharacterized protein Yka (UPF0111/DUF47 family)